MCGITGFIDFKQNSNEFDLQEMTKTLNKRGPDQTGFFFKKKANFNIGLGHTRLSIIDLSNRANQPMAIDNKVMVYNGEVYNYKEIRLELQNYGIKFFSDSDTEVILRAFIQWGTKCVDKFIGMFSIAIFDQKINKIYFFRDRAGVKPLYYCLHY